MRSTKTHFACTAFCGFAALLSVSTEATWAADVPSFARNGTFKVCTSGEFPPMEFYDKPGDKALVGFEIDVAEALAQQWGAKTDYVVGDFKGLLPSLDSQRCDAVMSGITLRPERLQKYDGIGYFTTSTVMVTAAGDSGTKVPEDFSGKTVAVEAGTTFEPTLAALNATFAKAGRPEAVLQPYPSASAVIQQILVGRAAGTITLDTTAAYRMAQTPGRLQVPYTYPDKEYYAIYLRKDAGDRKAVRAGLEALKAEGRMQDMLKKWNLSPEAVEVDGAAAR
ncbi:ABC transporter substrate-binding protein [Labrys sp. (in: a-proteobacteria)]|uniref:ABC transporter substrate-binding protein n=1 Tax=Labrys sp. (in: a-proteobacteria) TaxID=1917972 RepID=UPI0039E60B75